jgi:single-strand DNA-binding protein
MSLAQITVVGNLGKDPELRSMPNGTPVASFSICANQRGTDSQGQRTEKQIWFNANVYGNSAKAVAEHLRKGDQALVQGRIDPDIWTGDDGKARLNLVVNASTVQFLGKRRAAGEPSGEAEATSEAEVGGEPGDKIPF